jgi:threonine-phosphate decarboxylase
VFSATVSTAAGIAAFKDKDYEGHTYRLIEKEREFLTD